jgi:hypothetical protein
LEDYLWSGWSLFKGKWFAKTGKSFRYWIGVLLTMTRALIWHECLLHLLPNTPSYLQAHLLLQEIDRNVPTAEVRKWNILAATSWESIMSVVIQNCFAKCGVGTLSKVSDEEAEENSEFGIISRSHGLSQ